MNLTEQLSLYQSYHTKPITKLTHYIGVPALVFAAMILFGWVHISIPNIFSINLTWILLAALIIFYFSLDFLLAAGLGVILILMAFIAEFFSQPEITKLGIIAFLFFFITGVVAQLIGHLHEKKKPAFMQSLTQALIAPLYLFAEVMFSLGWRKDLEEKIKNPL